MVAKLFMILSGRVGMLPSLALPLVLSATMGLFLLSSEATAQSGQQPQDLPLSPLYVQTGSASSVFRCESWR